jgi:predicted RNA binding protein YcfA (HicA-like mRNA interferase family)
MTRLPRPKGKELVRALERAGFSVDRTRGSHVFIRHADGRTTKIPIHSGEIIMSPDKISQQTKRVPEIKPLALSQRGRIALRRTASKPSAPKPSCIGSRQAI